MLFRVREQSDTSHTLEHTSAKTKVPRSRDPLAAAAGDTRQQRDFVDVRHALHLSLFCSSPAEVA